MTVGDGATTGDVGYTRLIDPRRKWYSNRRLIALHAWIALLLITSFNNGYDGSMINGLQTLPQWKDYFHSPSGSMLGLLNAIQNIGSLTAYPFSPYLADGLGRKKTVFIGAVILCVAPVIQAAAQSVGMFIGARFLIGFGLTFGASAAPMLITEIAYPPYRGPLTSAYNSLWYSGAAIAAWSTFGTFKIKDTSSWRIPSALQALPAVLQVILVLVGPESPRWLISKGKDKLALDTLAYYHADGNRDDPLVQYEFHEIKNALDFDHTVAASMGWRALVATPGNGLVSYYLSKVFDSIGITDPTTQLLINGILQIWNLGWALLAAALCDRLGRRLLFLTSAVGMLVFFTMQTICSAEFAIHGSHAAAHTVIAFIFLFYASYDLAFTPLIISYSIEILPFPLRAKGFTVFNFAVSLSIIFNQYVNPVALDAIQWKYYVVYCCWLAFELIFLYFFVIETKNRTLEETSALFDGQGASQLQYGVSVDILSPSDKSSGSLCEPVDISIVSL
ncbi:Major Facilitator Superfamily Sugar Transporter [Pleurotus pulmonarius]